MTNGILPSRIGIVYLSPDMEVARRFGNNEVVLEVKTGNLKLTAFDDCKEWEIFCWGKIPPENIMEIQGTD